MGEIEINDRKEMLDINFIFHFLSKEANWSKGIPIERVKKSIENSLCFGAYSKGSQVGFGRAITDYSTFANIVDIFVSDKYRGQGIGLAITKNILAHPSMQGLRRITLATSQQGFYSKIGFKQLGSPEKFMEIYNPNVYTNNS